MGYLADRGTTAQRRECCWERPWKKATVEKGKASKDWLKE